MRSKWQHAELARTSSTFLGNPEGRTPQHIVDKLCESAQKDKTHGYSASAGIYKLRLAICNWYKRKYGVNLDPETEAVATMGSKEGFVHLAQAVINPGDVAIVPDSCISDTHASVFICWWKCRKDATSLQR